MTVLLKDIGNLDNLLDSNSYLKCSRLWNAQVERIAPAEFIAILKRAELLFDARQARQDALCALIEIRSSIAAGQIEKALIERLSVSPSMDRSNVFPLSYAIDKAVAKIVLANAIR